MTEFIIFIGIIAVLLYIGKRRAEREEEDDPALAPLPRTFTPPPRNFENELQQLVSTASEHNSAGRYEQCLRVIASAFKFAKQHALMDRPQFAILCNLRGVVHQSHGEWRAALNHYEIAQTILSKWSYGEFDESAVRHIAVIARNAAQAREYLGW